MAVRSHPMDFPAAHSSKSAAYLLCRLDLAPRTADNPVLHTAVVWADRLGLPLVAAIPGYDAEPPSRRAWLQASVLELVRGLEDLGIGSLCLHDTASEEAALGSAAALVSDAHPGHEPPGVAEARRRGLPFLVADSGSILSPDIMPARLEWAARTLRPKAEAALPYALEAPPLPAPTPKTSACALGLSWSPQPHQQPHARPEPQPATGTAVPAQAAAHTRATGAASALHAPTQGDRDADQTELPPPGQAEARRRMRVFLEERLAAYGDARNDPLAAGTSELSAYLARGLLSARELAREAQAAREQGNPGAPAFLEQLVVRRELCRNYARYAPEGPRSYRSIPDWCRAALFSAAQDRRGYVYEPAQFEAAATHDPYWNAAQEELVRTGTIHNYMRMYWGKMILAWYRSPEEAFATALYLNDRYALDGRDPNGWAGVAWCFGLHDRPWPSRPVFGTVRSMTASGLRKKFDADGYARRWAPQKPPAR